MSRIFLILLLLLPACTLAGEAEVQLLKVEDGDTLVVNLDGQETRVQLVGIDAPEDTMNPKLKVDIKRTGLPADQLLPLGEAATTHLRSLVQENRQERLLLSGNLNLKDRYGRVPAEVLGRDGRSLNAAMVTDGYARYLESDDLPEELRQHLKGVWELARKKKPGLWSSRPQTFQRWAGIEP